MVKFQPLLKVTSGSMAMQGQVLMSMDHIATGEHGGVPSLGSFQEPFGYSGIVKTWACPSLSVVALERMGLASGLGSTLDLALVEGALVSQLQRWEHGRPWALRRWPPPITPCYFQQLGKLVLGPCTLNCQ